MGVGTTCPSYVNVYYMYILISHMPLGQMELTDDDLDNISIFALCMEGTGLSQSTHVNLHHFFRHKLNIDTEYLMYHCMEILSGVTPVFYDMCNNSCCLFVAGLSGHRECPIVRALARSDLFPLNLVLNPLKPRSATPRFMMAVTKRSYAPSYNACLTSETAPKLSLQARQKFNMPSLTSPVPRSNTLNQRSLVKLLPSLYGLLIGTASTTNSK